MNGPATVDVVLTTEQNTAVEMTLDWLRHQKAQEFKVGGLAGTGKTTIIKKVVERAGICPTCMGTGEVFSFDFGFDIPEDGSIPTATCPNCTEGRSHGEAGICSFTGKAVSVLRRKGISSAITLHLMMYNFYEDPQTHEVIFSKKHRLETSSGREPEFVVVDEASMIDAPLHNDLLSFNKPILWVGDHGQLEPVGEDNINLMATCNIYLEQIHRNAGAIVDFAHRVRKGVTFLNGVIDSAQSKVICTSKLMGMNALLYPDIIIAAFNRERIKMNHDIRKLKGYDRRGSLVEGEKLIILKNNNQLQVFNGMIIFVEKILGSSTDYYDTIVSDEMGAKRHLQLFRTALEMGPALDIDRVRVPKDLVVVDYGYVITCHKSQGSEWDKVMVMDPGWFGTPERPWVSKARWQYTAATRAAKELIYCRK